MNRTNAQVCLVCGRTGTLKDSEACIGEDERRCIQIALDRQEIPMNQRYVVAFDPGLRSPTGLALWGAHGLAYSTQGPYLQILREWIPQLRRNTVPLVCVEAAFVGKNVSSALAVHGVANHIKGALWASGLDPMYWEPNAQAWRKAIGFPARVVKDGKRVKTRSEDYEEMARCHAAAHFGRAIDPERTHEAEAICMAQMAWEKLIEINEGQQPDKVLAAE